MQQHQNPRNPMMQQTGHGGSRMPHQQFAVSSAAPQQFKNIRHQQQQQQFQQQYHQQRPQTPQQQQQQLMSQKQQFLQQNRMPKFKPPPGKDPFSSFTIRNNAEQLSISLENRTITSGAVKPKLNQMPTRCTSNRSVAKPPT
jgi:transketolase